MSVGPLSDQKPPHHGIGKDYHVAMALRRTARCLNLTVPGLNLTVPEVSAIEVSANKGARAGRGGAEERTRTSTSVTSQEPESCASASSATSACDWARGLRRVSGVVKFNRPKRRGDFCESTRMRKCKAVSRAAIHRARQLLATTRTHRRPPASC